ncbi:hypothetical protein A3742_12910 [Oleiphilus sp. HI0071]|uniref:oligosaccharide flippase family protein n=1 Tax=unclassified Oleiphilus TaxID=2631174 RepID=UPI0007C26C51|nr:MULTISPECIES: oligosaccharide flippase family protein [unclassified Oleiphilus]KZY64007.1 hypothetical protein A3737_14355 [Oleiphilus sp. HI0065]KZY80364.1 hypothetical protein A3742_12910 [Oleiphilus sp. HI0071]KZZ06113.1 hypothetical protein A3744_07505 [Oleiphilus sp. HI0073]KZZ40168.1 hypothetical protein A3758_09860 [Oleiphilus sp. HI0118]KZZ51926.1 hypothetical protein A3760_11225 [Oleiphilus sp. HI0122]KZZ70652.1 hypothetical protein A3765_16165 [Oleiphilus sp. HI0130]KZZ76310.1 h
MTNTKSGNTLLFSESAQKAIPWTLLSKSLLFIVYFLISILSVRLLGTEQYGLFVICRSIADVLILVCTLGMTASFVRFIPELVLHKDLSGIKRLIGTGFILQSLALVVIGLGMYLSQHHIEQYFSVAFNGALLFTFILMVCEQLKTSINSILTALYQTKRMAVFSVLNGIIWICALALLLNNDASVSNALSAQALSYGLIYLVAAGILWRYLKSLNWQSQNNVLSAKRVFNQSGSIALSTLVRLLMLKYTELFFLGGMTDAETVGMYDLAFSLPMMVIVFIPAAVHELFVSGVSEAYVKDPRCLPTLIKALYKILILIAVPIAVFGFMFAGEMLIYCYGEEVRGVYELTMAFCLLHLLPLISTPLSVGIQVREEVMRMFPTLMLQLTVNILLDYLLIVELNMGIWGAFTALILTFVLTIPIRLYLVSKILGGIYFPGAFFIRVLFVTLAVGYAIRVLLAPESLFSIAPLFFVYLVSTLAVLIKFRFINEADITDLDIFLRGKVHQVLSKLNHTRSAKLSKSSLVITKQLTE